MPKVHNRHHNTAPDSAVYIGRGSEWGNPFKIGRDGDRDTVCDKYEEMVFQSPSFIQYIKESLKGRDLVCFCAPKRCHGDFLLRIANADSPRIEIQQDVEYAEVLEQPVASTVPPTEEKISTTTRLKQWLWNQVVANCDKHRNKED
jgi:hypothetical protein